ncbi:unnamed protein product [Larinioides sclopetarius]|uniref:acid phosphatase n=1 Tax=Larinioides sclopetarius TaxID=280406 RepID=A0AAV2B654_9ARAC
MWRFFFLAGLTCLFLDHVFTVDDVKKSGKRELVYLQLLTTNGFHAPLSLYPNDENTEDDWPEGMGLLTKLGKLQQYEMGKFLRKFYHHFITSDPGEVDAFSSFEDRSTIGLVTLMASLYAPTEEWEFLPGFKWQPTVLCYMEKKDIHDWNLAAVLSAMRLSNGFRPPPCATISFEMYKQDEEYTVRALFFNLTNPEMGADQDPHPLLLEGCTEYCPLASFVRFFAPVIPEYKKLCGKKIKDPEDVDMEAETTLIHMYADLKAWTTPLPM